VNIAIASGKGGTGKTTLSLALAIANRDRARLLDCDVEEPDCHLFLGEERAKLTPVFRPVPVVDLDKCDRCGKCATFCQYNALSVSPRAGALVFPELCHSCGGCQRVCPQGAIHEENVEVGSLSQGFVPQGFELVTGRLGVGHALAPSVIRAVQRSIPMRTVEFDFFDAPPGTACPFMTTAGAADFVLLVTEPTPFGLHDLKLAVEALRRLNKPMGVIINRMDNENNRVSNWCAQNNVPQMLTIPNSRAMAECYARAGTLLDVFPHLEEALRRLPAQCIAYAGKRSGL